MAKIRTKEQLKVRLSELVNAGREIQANVTDSFYKKAAKEDADKLIEKLLKDIEIETSSHKSKAKKVSAKLDKASPLVSMEDLAYLGVNVKGTVTGRFSSMEDLAFQTAVQSPQR